jgi:hypothetical protein
MLDDGNHPILAQKNGYEANPKIAGNQKIIVGIRGDTVIKIWQAVHRVGLDSQVCPATQQTISPFNPKII